MRSVSLVPIVAAVALIPGVAGCGGDTRQAIIARTVGAPPPTVAKPVKVGIDPTAIAVGEGAVWVANSAEGTVSHLDARTGRVLGKPIPVGSGPMAIALAPDGVWVASGNGDVVRIDRRTGRTAGRALHVTDPAGVAVGAGGVWVTSRARGMVTRLDPATGRTTAEIRVGRRPTDVVVQGGAVWVANSAEGTLSRIDPASNAPDAPVRVAQGAVLALAGGPRGLWAAKADTELAQPVELVRIDPTSGRLVGPALRVPGGTPMRLAVGETAVWATDVGNAIAPTRAPAVTRVDPDRSAIAGAPIPVGADPAGIAYGDGAVWVANAGAGTVTRIQPPASR